MTTFTDFALATLGDHTDQSPRRDAWRAFELAGLPTTSDEVWRYAPLGEFALDRYVGDDAHHEGEKAALDLSGFASALRERAGVFAHVVDGRLVAVEGAAEGLDIHFEGDVATSDLARYGADSFALMNCALRPGTIVVSVANGARVDEPILIVNHTGATTSFPHLRVVLGRSATATIVEYVEGGVDALVVPVSEFLVDENASLQVSTYQRLDHSAWHVARSTGTLQRDARLRQSVISLGGHYDRSRNDAELLGPGAENELRTTFLGSGDQVHDFRTRQYHVAARTRSTLLSKGAVADTSRSVYTGLIEIEKRAKRTDARQTNHNLLLSPHAHADSVPNLDIRENDVMCAHASSVGPLDELQRWYLESRGVARHDAERLMIQGFFYEMLASLPSQLAAVVEADIAASLAALQVVTP